MHNNVAFNRSKTQHVEILQEGALGVLELLQKENKKQHGYIVEKCLFLVFFLHFFSL
jgi:hypothetical protein